MIYNVDTYHSDMQKELTLTEKIKDWRIKSNIIVLLDKYETLHDLDADYNKFLAMDHSLRRISNFKSLELFGKINRVRYIELKSPFLEKEDVNDINDIYYNPKLESDNIELFKGKDGTKYVYNADNIIKFKDNFSKVTSGIYRGYLSHPLELVKSNYRLRDITDMVQLSMNDPKKQRVVFHKDTKENSIEKDWFGSKKWGIVAYTGSRGYIYCIDTGRFYAFSKTSNPNINHKNPMTYSEVIHKEKEDHGLENINNIIAAESYYDYGIKSDIITEMQAIDIMNKNFPNNPITEALKEDMYDRIKDADKVSVEKDVPYFTPSELQKLGISGQEVPPLFSNNPDLVTINEKKIKKWQEEYTARYKGFASTSYTPSYIWRNTISKLSEDLHSLQGQELLDRKQTLLDLGWNPEIPFTEKARLYAKQRIEESVNIPTIHLYDYKDSGIRFSKQAINESFESGEGNLFIVFTERFKQGYKNFGISFDESLETIYLYDTNTCKFHKGKAAEDINVYTSKLDKDVIHSIFKKNTVEYGIASLNEMYCLNTKLIVKNTINELCKSINRSPSNISVYNIYEGPRTEYTLQESVDPSLEFIALSEAKEFPVQFDEDGNLLISKGKNLDYEAEYAATHMAMKTYEKAKAIDGMKYCMCKLWYLNLMITDEIKHTKDKKKLYNLHKARAKIINDIKTYMPIILKHDPQFNIEEEYQNSPFSDHTTKINKSTIEYTMELLKKLISFV